MVGIDMVQPLDIDEILERLDSSRETLRGFGVVRLGVFGSFARLQQSSGSDIDITVEFQPGKKSFANFMGVLTFLEELLGRSVDLVTPESLSPYIKQDVLKESRYVAVA